LVDWEVGFELRKLELRIPRRPPRCGRVGPMIGDGRSPKARLDYIYRWVWGFSF